MRYPFLELNDALIQLLESMDVKEHCRETLFKKQTIGHLTNQLLTLHLQFFDKPEDLNFSLTRIVNSSAVNQAEILFKLRGLAATVLPLQMDQHQLFYSHCWLMQQFIRQALNDTCLLAPEFYQPFLHAAMENMIKSCKPQPDIADGYLKLQIIGEAGETWVVAKVGEVWSLADSNMPSTNLIYVDQQVAWLLFSGILNVSEIGQYVQIFGNNKLAYHLLRMRLDEDILGHLAKNE